MTSFDVPILLLAWRRPGTLRQVIDAIRPIAPRFMFVACDGPRPDSASESVKVAATRKVIETEIDWPCQIERLYSDVNQGCRLGVSKAITWFFDQVEEGIVLEDDCVPHADFFPFCSTLLERYRDDSRVWCISGQNYQYGQWRGDSSYYFSRYNHCWGWASWRRCWHYYDSELTQWPALRDSGLLKTIFENSLEGDYWSAIWQRQFDHGYPDSWAYRWFFTCVINSGLTALPNTNLVANVGFGEDATHTLKPEINVNPALPLGPLTHPDLVIRDWDADSYSYAHHFGGIRRRRLRTLQQRINRRLSMALTWMGFR